MNQLDLVAVRRRATFRSLLQLSLTFNNTTEKRSFFFLRWKFPDCEPQIGVEGLRQESDLILSKNGKEVLHFSCLLKFSTISCIDMILERLLLAQRDDYFK